MFCYAVTCSTFSHMLPKLTVKTASSDNAPSISKSFVALPPPPTVANGNADAVAQSQPSTMATIDDSGGLAVALDVEVDTGSSPPPPPPPRRLPSPPVAGRTTSQRLGVHSQPAWHVVSATLNSPRQKRCRPSASSRLRDLDVNSGSVQERSSVKTSSSADWLRLLEKLGDTQFGEVHQDIRIVIRYQGANYKKNLKIILRCDNNLRLS